MWSRTSERGLEWIGARSNTVSSLLQGEWNRAAHRARRAACSGRSGSAAQCSAAHAVRRKRGGATSLLSTLAPTLPGDRTMLTRHCELAKSQGRMGRGYLHRRPSDSFCCDIVSYMSATHGGPNSEACRGYGLVMIPGNHIALCRSPDPA